MGFRTTLNFRKFLKGLPQDIRLLSTYFLKKYASSLEQISRTVERICHKGTYFKVNYCVICEEEIPKKPIGRLSLEYCQPSVSHLLADCQPTVGQKVLPQTQTTNLVVSSLLVCCRLRSCRQPVDNLLADSRPKGFLGSSSSQLPTIAIKTINSFSPLLNLKVAFHFVISIITQLILLMCQMSFSVSK